MLSKRLKIPKLKVPKMSKRGKRMMMVSLIALSFFIAGGIMFSPEGTIDIFEHGTARYSIVTAGISTELTAGTIVYADVSSARVIFEWTSDTFDPPATDDFPVELKRSVWDVDIVEKPTKIGNIYTFDFDLKKCDVGENTYYFQLGCTSGQWFFSGNSFSFTVSNLFKTSDAPVFVPPLPEDITEQPEGYYVTLDWDYIYDGPATLTLQQDGVVIDTKTIEGSAYEQEYVYVFDPGEEGDWRFRFTIDPDEILHLPIWDEMDVGVVTWEDYTLLEGLPEGVECNVEVAGQIAFFNILPSKQVWNAEFAAPAMTPLDGKMTVVLHTWSFTGVEILILKGGEEVKRVTMSRAIGTWFIDIDLNTLEDGEYVFEIRAEYASNLWYRITTFNMAVRVFPTGWFVVNIGLLLLIGVLAIGTIIALRRFRGWWGYQGRYAT